MPVELIQVIPHWIDLKPFRKAQWTGVFRKRFGVDERFIFAFGGVLGPSQGLGLIVRLANRLRENKDIIFLFVGEGSEKSKLIKITEGQGLKNIIFGPLISKGEYPSFLKDMDVGFFSLTSKNTTPAVPAKLMGYMAAGLPVVAFLHKESEVHKIIKDAGCGFSALYNDEDAALNIVLKMYRVQNKLREYGERGFRYAEEHFTPEVCAEKWEKLF